MRRREPPATPRDRPHLSRQALLLRGAATAAASSLSVTPWRGVAAGAGVAGAPAVGAPATLGQADALLAGLVRRRLFRGSVLLTRRGHILLSRGYDWADEAGRIPNTAHTRFRIASITKQFTAMAVLLLQDQGKLRVQDRLRTYLSPCPAAWESITLHQLLTHTSGIPDYTTSRAYPALATRPLTLAQVIALFRDRPLDFRPGSRWSYSNSGYVLLGYLVERVSGMPYAQFLSRHIFAPLGLRETGEGAAPPAAGPYATGYAAWGRPAAYERNAYAAGDLYSTVGDLYRWDQALTTGRPAFASARARRAMFTPYVPTDPADPRAVSYGYGWFIGYEGAHREVEHTGEISGFLSANQLYPDDRLTVIVLSNLASDQGLRALTIALAGIALGYRDCASLAQPCSEL